LKIRNSEEERFWI